MPQTAAEEVFRLDPDFKAKWIAALTSGEYRQGREHLYSPTSGCFCCLGVGCAISGVPLPDLTLRAYPLSREVQSW